MDGFFVSNFVGKTEFAAVNLIMPLPMMLGACVTYGRILLLTLTPFMLQIAFQSFLVTAEKPKLGLIVTMAAGLTLPLFFDLDDIWMSITVAEAMALVLTVTFLVANRRRYRY